MIRRFKLAAMSPSLSIMTWSLFGLLVFMVYKGIRSQAFVLGAAGFVALIFAVVWLWFRPSHFEVDDKELRIIWPVRKRVVPRLTIESARLVDAEAFRRAYGYGMRIGAGGLWGAFGLLKTKSKTFSMWISRTDHYVIVKIDGDRPLLITPDRPKELVTALSPRDEEDLA